MTTYVYIATSLDGFIAGRDGGLWWFSEFMSGIDLIMMGRNTFEAVRTSGEWPYNKPVWVLSRTLTEMPPGLSGRAELRDGSREILLERASQAGFVRVYVNGGTVIRSFLENDLIDEMIITAIPIVLGRGVSLFREFSHQLRFSLRKSETLIGQLAKNHYTRDR
jgi:dihydrofolate reductase